MVAPMQSRFLTEMLPPEGHQYERLTTRIPIVITGLDGIAMSEECVCTDISAGGIVFQSSADFYPGDIIQFYFVQTDGYPISYRARIIYTEEASHGAGFLEPE